MAPCADAAPMTPSSRRRRDALSPTSTRPYSMPCVWVRTSCWPRASPTTPPSTRRSTSSAPSPGAVPPGLRTRSCGGSAARRPSSGRRSSNRTRAQTMSASRCAPHTRCGSSVLCDDRWPPKGVPTSSRRCSRQTTSHPTSPWSPFRVSPSRGSRVAPTPRPRSGGKAAIRVRPSQQRTAGCACRMRARSWSLSPSPGPPRRARGAVARSVRGPGRQDGPAGCHRARARCAAGGE